MGELSLSGDRGALRKLEVAKHECGEKAVENQHQTHVPKKLGITDHKVWF